MRFFTQSLLYDDPWAIVSLAFFMRYPNPYASHVLSCDVISRTVTTSGTLLTTRLILKSGSLPKWAPQGIVSRAESWVVEESEVDPNGKVMRCITKNLDHVKVMSVEERILLEQPQDGKSLLSTEARFVSGFGWGLTKSIENHGLAKFKANIQRSREGLSVILNLIRQSRMQHMTLGGHSSFVDAHPSSSSEATSDYRSEQSRPCEGGSWRRLKSWFRAY